MPKQSNEDVMEFKTVRQELDAFYKIASKNFKRANISNTAIVIAYYTLVGLSSNQIFGFT